MSSQGQKNCQPLVALQGPVGVNYMEQIIVAKNNVVKDGEFVVFTECDYEIPVRDLSSQYWIAEWIRHMSEKTWVTKEMLGQFASIIQQINTVSAK